MIRLNVKLDVASMQREFAADRKQVRFATAVALTRTAKFAEKKVQEEIGRSFDRPTAFTKRATFVTPATKQNLVAEVKIKDESFKAVAPIKWLAPQIYGGPRGTKRLEDLLRSRGILAQGRFAIPASGAKLDRHGNMSRGQIVQILSQLGAARDYLQNQTARSKGRNRGRAQYFALVHPRGKLEAGVYQRIGQTVRPVLVFTNQPRYRKRLRFFEVAHGSAQMRFPIEFRLAMTRAMATAR